MKTKEMVYVAMFTAFMCVLGYLPPIPLPFSPVPITIQTLGVMLAGGLLGARLGIFSQLVFLSIVAVGAPVLSGGRGGLSAFVAPTAGYLWSFPIAALVIGFLTERFWNGLTFRKAFIVNVIGGVLVIHAIGIPVLSMVTNMGLGKAFLLNLVYIPGDLIKALLAAYVAVKIKRIKPLIKEDSTFVA